MAVRVAVGITIWGREEGGTDEEGGVNILFTYVKPEGVNGLLA